MDAALLAAYHEHITSDHGFIITARVLTVDEKPAED